MRLRRAVLQNPPKSSVPQRLPLYNNCPLLTRLESTLLQVLIPLHFNSPRINTYKKPGRGPLPKAPKFCNSSLPAPCLCSVLPRHISLATIPVTPFPATLAYHSQLAENPATLSPLPATLTSYVKPNPCVCHSYKKHGGWGTHLNRKSPSAPTPQLSLLTVDCRLPSVTMPPHSGAIHA